MAAITITCPKCGKTGSFDIHGIPKPGSGPRSCRHCHRLVTIYLDNKGNVQKVS